MMEFRRIAGTSPAESASRRQRSAYTLMEMLVTLLIIQVLTAMVMYSVTSVSDTTRLDVVSKRTIGAIRYARMLAMSTGQTCNVDFNFTSQTIGVYLGSSTTPVANALFPGGKCLLTLGSDQGISGVKMTAVTNAATAAVPGSTIYRCTYGKLGTRSNAPSYSQPMTLTFSYGGTSSTLTIPNAGDPQ